MPVYLKKVIGCRKVVSACALRWVSKDDGRFFCFGVRKYFRMFLRLLLMSLIVGERLEDS